MGFDCPGEIARLQSEGHRDLTLYSDPNLEWIREQAVVLRGPRWQVPVEAEDRLALVDDRIGNARLLFLGETNHFVQEKTDFRLFWLERILRLNGNRPVIIAEELGWADGRRVADYLNRGDRELLGHAATFGGTRHRRTDRDDAPTGVFAESLASYPHDLMRRAHERFYQGVRSLGLREFFGFDVDAPCAGYEPLQALLPAARAAGLRDDFWTGLAQVPGESLPEELARLEQLAELSSSRPGYEVIEADLTSLIESFHYATLVNAALDFEATAPAMAYREDTMKRRLDHIIGQVPDDALIVLLGHAFHLVKKDAETEVQGVGPGGGRTASLGHYLVQERGFPATASWMIYGGGRDSQPLKDLPREADYPPSSLNRLLLPLGGRLVLPLTGDCPWPDGIGVGHLYNMVQPMDVCAQTDSIYFVPEVTPLD